MTLGKLINLLEQAKELYQELSKCDEQSPEYEAGEKAWKEWKKRRAAIVAKQKKLYGVKL